MNINKFSGEYEFLSNFYLCPLYVEYDGWEYPTSEHAFQAAKTLDLETRMKICICNTPGQAKRLGRKVLLRADWEKIKLPIMKSILLSKFNRNPKLKKALIDTEYCTLEEGNNWGDTFWGVCNGKGSNYLGKLLMLVRVL